MGRALWAWLAAALLLAVSVAAAADERPRIALMLVPERPPLAARIATELGTMGFEAVIVPHAGGSVDELGLLTRRANAIAGAMMRVDEQRIRLWIVDRTTDKILTRELPAAARHAEAMLALRAVELLRASLLELALPRAPRGDREATPSLLAAAGVPEAEAQAHEQAPPSPHPAPQVALATPPRAMLPIVLARGPSPAALARTASRPPLLGLELGPALVGGAGDLALFPALLVGATYFGSPELSVGALALAPLGELSHSAPEGSSTSRITLLAVEAGWQPAQGVLRPFLRLGPSAALLRTRGQTQGDLLESASDSAITFGAALRGGLALELIPGLYLRPHGAAGLQHRYFSLQYGGRSAARWGAAWWALSFVLEAELLR
jgi:hypothetical protein